MTSFQLLVLLQVHEGEIEEYDPTSRCASVEPINNALQELMGMNLVILLKIVPPKPELTHSGEMLVRAFLAQAEAVVSR